MSDPTPGDVIDDDVAQAVQAVWQAQGGASLPALVREKPKWGRGKSPDPVPYAHIEVEFDRRELAGAGTPAPWYDNRRVTLKVWALKDDAVKVQGILVSLFNLQTTLTFPSGARLLKLWPDGGATLNQDPATKDGRDLWIAQSVFTVRSVRLQ